MDWLLYLVAFALFLFGAACVVLVVLQLPGAWILLAVAVVIEVFDGVYLTSEPPVTFGWPLLGASLAVLVLGEIIEFLSSAVGASRGGATRRGVIGSLVGGVLGAIALTPLIPIPVVGTLIGAVIGTFLGAIVGEVTGATPRPVASSVKPAVAAGIGRVVGTMSKVAIAVALWITLVVAAVI